MTARALVGWNADSQHLFRHILASGSLHFEKERWVPVSFDLIHGRRSIGLEGRLPLAEELVMVEAGLLEIKAHRAPEGHLRGAGKSREYRVPAELQARYDAALGTGARVNLFTGKPTTKRRKTTRQDENRNPYPKPIQAGMDGIPFGLYHREDATAHVALSLALAEEAEARVARLTGLAGSTAHANTRATREAARDVRDATEGRRALPYDAETRDAIQDAERLRGRYTVDKAVLFKLKDRSEQELLPGIFRYTAAWEPQRFGRITDVGGGLQNATREMKAACLSRVPAVRNYDLKSSQPRQLSAWFDLAGIPTDELEAVLLGDKAAEAERLGLTIDGFKHGTMGLVMGGILFATLEAGTDRDGTPRGEVVESILAGTLPGVDPADAYAAFETRTRLLYTQLQAFRHYLVHVWLPANEYRANGGRRYVRNATGATFDVTATLDKNGRTTAKTGRKLAAFLLQGTEAAFIYTLTVIAPQFGYTVLGNEHDGLITLGPIPEEAVQSARDHTGLHSAVLVEKPFC